MAPRALHALVEDAGRRYPDHVAIEEVMRDGSTEATSYATLLRLSDRMRDRLRQSGVTARDRVGLYLRKSTDAVAAILGVLKAGAAYVPVDPNAPPSRNAFIFTDCAVRLVVVERRFEERLRAELAPLGAAPALLVLEEVGGGRGLARALDDEDARAPAPTAPTATPAPDDLAYILYTSGSTGKPKGVMLSHENATSFVSWCSDVFQPTPSDRCSSHAPFHFDLSILDIYLSLKHGATLVLIGEELGREPHGLADFLVARRLTIWYSAPSILTLLVQYSDLGGRDLSSLRHVLFAGEVFPVKHLRAFQRYVPGARYFNLYGPTETNVCTYYEIGEVVPPERTEPYPIGSVCSHLEARVLDPEGRDVPRGDEGELCIAGPGVMQGYWGQPEQTERAFHHGPGGTRWYRTGDLVIEGADGNYVFRGRRDRMVKRRGYRVELGEIEAGLYRHPAVREAAVIAVADADGGVRIKAFLACTEGKRPSLIELKAFCAGALPAYMIPDVFAVRDALPKTSTDKVDYQRLKELG